MEKIVYIDEVGWCKEITVNRYNDSGINEPYVYYEPIEK